jgi:glycogen debranching enzyme
MAARILSAFTDVSSYVDLHRLPELLCGLDQRSGEGPTLYPVACAPQAWAAGAIFMMLEACLGISLDATRQQLILDEPYLPPTLSQLWIRRLEVGPASVDLYLERFDNDVRVEIIDMRGNLDVIVR